VVWKTADGFVVWKQLNVGQAASWELLKAIIKSDHLLGTVTLFRYFSLPALSIAASTTLCWHSTHASTCEPSLVEVE